LPSVKRPTLIVYSLVILYLIMQLHLIGMVPKSGCIESQNNSDRLA
jgi:hypothetical protein